MIRVRFSLTLLFLLGSVAIAALFVWPEAKDVRTTQIAWTHAEYRLTREQEIVSAFSRLQDALELRATEIARAEKAVPTLGDGEDDVPALIATIEELAEREAGGIYLLGLRIGDAGTTTPTTPGTKLAARTLWTRDITINGLGNYESVSRFLTVLSSSLRILEPVLFNFTAANRDAVVPFGVTVRAFVQTP